MPDPNLIARRDLLKTAVGLGLGLAFGCRTFAMAPTPGECPAPTSPNLLGPFFRPRSPERANLDLYAERDATRLAIAGRVVDTTCVPLAGALVDVWHADGKGGYDNDTAEMRYRGHVLTDADGRYAFQTIVPGRYLNGAQYRPAHVHFQVHVDGQTRLTTQLYFDGDPFNRVDRFVRPGLIRPVVVDQERWNVEFDIVLA